MKKLLIMTILVSSALLISCKPKEKKTETRDFKFLVEQFADLKVMRYQVPGFDSLSLK